MKSSDIPTFFYGTAWKEERTAPLVRLALESGFRAIDTANQRKHYCEEAVGDALKQAVSDGLVSWEELFVQTKFTHLGGQDHRLPYDPEAAVSVQVRQSWESSLEHLQKVDSLVLHGPTRRFGLGPDDEEAWLEICKLKGEGQVGSIGLSNVSAEQVREFCGLGDRPDFVQNRCYASRGWDGQVRTVCKELGIRYQGFSLLTANVRELQHPSVLELARARSWSWPQLVFCFAIGIGMLPLTGTSNPTHMAQDLAVLGSQLEPEDLSFLESIASS